MSISPSMLPFTELVEMVKAPRKIKKSEYLEYKPRRVPIVDQGDGLVGGYTDDLTAIISSSEPLIVFGDHTCRFKYIDFPFAAGADGTQIFKARHGLNTRYVYYACLSVGVDLYGYQRHFKHLKASYIPVFDASVQRKIVYILSAYDDLIQKNSRRMKLLEEMASLLFEEWFVNFRFPGCREAVFKESEIGEIPEDWEVTEVKLLVNRKKNGRVYKKEEVSGEGQILVIDQSRAEFLGFHSNEADHDASPEDPIIIFGDHTCKMQIMVSPFSIGPNTIAFSGKTKHSVYYLFSLVKGLMKTQEYKRHWGDLMKKRVAQAPVELSLEYGTAVEPMFRMAELLRIKNRNLRAQRDLLLPKLVSGEVNVSDIPMPEDKEVEAA